MSADEIVVTGVGLLSHLGDDPDATAAQIRRGEGRAFSHLPEAMEAGCGCYLAGIYDGDLSNERIGIDRKAARFLGRASRMAVLVARQALDTSGVATDGLAVVFGSGTGDVATHIELEQQLGSRGARGVGPTVIPRIMASTVSANLVNVLRTTGPSVSAAAACAGGAWNLAIAAQLVREGHATAALAGGVEVWDLHFHAGFDSMRAYNRADNERPERASRPYAADRAGFLFGEGAGALVLERRSTAEARGVPILGRLLGWGMSSDGAGEMVAPAWQGALAAMSSALRHSGLGPEVVDYVNTHATSTPVGDLSEVRAMRELFGGRPVPYSSTKAYTGHMISAAGAVEAVLTLAMLREGWLAPCAHAEPVDPELADWPPVLAPVEATPRVGLSNSFGFGGTNASLVLAAP